MKYFYIQFFFYTITFLILTLISLRYDKLGCQGAINSISFTHSPEDKDNNNDLSKDGAYPTSSTLPASSFVVNDFSVSTTKANFLYFKTDGSTVEVCYKHFFNFHLFLNILFMSMFLTCLYMRWPVLCFCSIYIFCNYKIFSGFCFCTMMLRRAVFLVFKY